MKKLSCLFIALALVACSKKYEPAFVASGPVATLGVEIAKPGAAPAPGSQPADARRYIAFKHQIELSTPAAQLQQDFTAIKNECQKLGCEILEANQLMETPHSSPSATLTARVPPKAFEAFLSSAQAHGKMVSYRSESEDKTAEVINVEAKIKNTEALRDRIKELLARRTGDLKETLEAEKQLAETQSELDSINGMRRALAQQTDMVRVEIKLVSQSFASERSFIAPVSEAVKESGLIFMNSLGGLIMVVVGGLPWLVLLVGLFFLVRRIRRGMKARAARSPG